MPRVGYKQTEIHKNNIRKKHIGKSSGVKGKHYTLSKKTIQKRKETLLKKYTNGFKPALGKHWKLSEQAKINIKNGAINLVKSGKHHLWKGGISFEPYGLEFNDDLKEVIRNRDRRKCQICVKTELENGKKLSVHHCDYNKQNNNPNNLIILCQNCHSKTNHNREYWIKKFIT